MRIVEKGTGRTERWSVEGNILAFPDRGFSIDMAGAQRDYPIHIDICEDGEGNLALGVVGDYVAELDLPPREFEIEVGPADDYGFPILKKTGRTMDLSGVCLTLWPAEE